MKKGCICDACIVERIKNAVPAPGFTIISNCLTFLGGVCIGVALMAYAACLADPVIARLAPTSLEPLAMGIAALCLSWLSSRAGR